MKEKIREILKKHLGEYLGHSYAEAANELLALIEKERRDAVLDYDKKLALEIQMKCLDEVEETTRNSELRQQALSGLEKGE